MHGAQRVARRGVEGREPPKGGQVAETRLPVVEGVGETSRDATRRREDAREGEKESSEP